MKKNIYFVKSDKDSPLSKQLEWTNYILSNDSNGVFNSDKRVFHVGEIFECVFYTQFGDKVIKKSIVMKSSGEYDSYVYICPIEEKIDGFYRNGVDLGFIASLGLDHEYVALINHMQLVKKDAFKVNCERIKDAKLLGVLDKRKFLKLIYRYRDYIDKYIDFYAKTDEPRSFMQNPLVC